MYQQTGNGGNAHWQSTGRHLLKTSVAVGLGIGAAALPGGRPLRPAAAAGVQGGHLNILNVGYPEVWDPHLAGTVLALAAISPLYNQVVEFNPLNPQEVIGDLARSWEETQGGLSFVFHLHDNVKWTDGKDVTAEDVVFSLNRMIEPGKPRPRVGLLRPYIKAAEAVNRHTVKVTLNYPSPAFLQFLAVDYMKILPKHILEAGVDINVWENIVGSGPCGHGCCSGQSRQNPPDHRRYCPWCRRPVTSSTRTEGQMHSLLAARRDGCVACLRQC